ncbi:hypothetical protein QJS10_CPA08g00123 [Acorus calamus]|uniref:Uncharacterized protein n=1 Tax=Acorus calamus TaxID=4465 RepID=A0AAV9E7Y5_ACOCL|nr:hypothetical protein QJS10_CPA08g00123 [Acorus calamus]
MRGTRFSLTSEGSKNNRNNPALTPQTWFVEVHIVYLGHNHASDPLLTTKSHLQLLSKVFDSEDDAKRAILYSYKHSFSGFTAVLETTQASTLARVWPESKSFREVPGTGPPPPTWTGTCVSGESFDPSTACNRKLVGARYYIAGFEHEFGPLNTSGGLEFRSPRDRLGHGTHVCWAVGLSGRCAEADILAAYDDALSDGVRVISASFGAAPPLMRFFETSSDIESFHAAQVGVAVVFSAGNDGPEPSIIGNVAPWAITVAASSVDRNFPTAVVLGNNVSITVYINTYFRDCSFDKWRGKPATRTIILCFSTVASGSSILAALAILAANGSGLIFAEPMARLTVDVDFFPIVHVNIIQGTQILYYIKSSK